MNRNSMEEYTKEKMKAYKDLLFYTNVTKLSIQLFGQNISKEYEETYYFNSSVQTYVWTNDYNAIETIKTDQVSLQNNNLY